MLSDSDDDIPIAEILKRKRESESGAAVPKVKIEKKDESASKEDKSHEETSAQRVPSFSNQKASSGPVSDDSDDDIPISELIKKRQAQQKANLLSSAPPAKKIKLDEKETSSRPTRQSTNKNGKEQSKNKTEKSHKPQKESSDSGRSPNASVVSDFYDQTKKGFLVQTLLRRWWYAITWPAVDDVFEPPSGYEPLEGFRGVFVCTSTANLGHILDLRDASSCPCLRNLARKPAAELQRLCIQAIRQQIQQLRDSGNSTKDLERRLQDEMKQVEKVSTDKADKEGLKYRF